jgi:P4 family phage/plasmid primase-like protien
MSATSVTTGRIVGLSWRTRAGELATWTEHRMVNRRDVSGSYYDADDGTVKPTTSHDWLTRERIVRHYQAKDTHDVLGLHTTARVALEKDVVACLSLWDGVDIDQHGPGEFSEANFAAAVAWRDVLAGLGFHPLLTDSNGRGGFHLRVLFDEPVITAHVRQLMRWLTRDWKELGLDGAPEVFPKQSVITADGNGSCGNWLRLPGRHHKRDHWSRVLDGDDWLQEDEAIDFILGLTGDPAQLIPNEALSFEPEGGRQTSTRAGDPKSADDVRFAKEALAYLGKGVKHTNGLVFVDDYSMWLTIGMSLYDLGDVGLELWKEWSKQGKSYQTAGPNSCAAKWDTFKAAGSQGVTLGTLFYHARRAGWPGIPINSVNEALDDPHRLARLHCEKHKHNGEPTLRFYRGESLKWLEGAYRPITDSELKAGINLTVKQEFDRINQDAVKQWEARAGKDDKGKPVQKPEARKVTRHLVADVNQALQAMTILPSAVAAPAWLDDQRTFDPVMTLPARNALVSLPDVVGLLPNVRPMGRAIDASKAILAPTPRFFSTHAIDFDFNLDAVAPIEWIRFLDSLWGKDNESIDTLQQWFGYAITPDTRQQKILGLIGPKRAGKDTIARVLTALVGPDNTAGPTLASLSGDFGLAPLIGKPLAIVSDARISKKSDAATIVERLLTISGEGRVGIARKFIEEWTGKLPTRFMLISNELPQLADSSGALAGRMILLRLTKSFYDVEDLTLFDRLIPELPGILLWALEGWRQLRKKGRFSQPKSGLDLLESLEELSSPMTAFIRERCNVGPTFEVETKVLYEKWVEWCGSIGEKRPGTAQWFARDLRAACSCVSTYRSDRGGKDMRFYRGIELKQAF